MVQVSLQPHKTEEEYQRQLLGLWDEEGYSALVEHEVSVPIRHGSAHCPLFLEHFPHVVPRAGLHGGLLVD